MNTALPSVVVILGYGLFGGGEATALGQSYVFGGVSTGLQVDSDPFLGDWQGEWTGKGQVFEDYPVVVAQVIPRGGGQYQINILPEFDQRCPPYLVVHGNAEGGEIRFELDGWSGTMTPERFTGSGEVKRKPGRFELKKVVRLSPTLGAKPPDEANVLFDGSGFDEWEASARGKSTGINWTIEDGFMRIRSIRDAKRHSLRTKRRFGDVRVHVEFRLPLEPENLGQGRANSGVYVGGFEVQVLDSYGLPGYYNECGSLYKQAAPMVNMCAPPLQWQTYDITFRSPRYGQGGAKIRDALFTVYHNGVLIHKDREVSRRGRSPKGDQDADQDEETRFQPATINLQNHGHALEYRNIWAVELAAED